ncbi:RNA 2'-phosphotransferase [Pyrobaculum neutrophilum]|uniref:Probable RNA 2'-phosphotransferase n=1 Tax=Pyrobaculum neutrophilum (strain DSM 2338 / JCM 9278 / NBRC 100436 / V24Sta) TaxID=444157 RepID=B1YDK5_PYRNV|nr:RNA 2'-phosphotransferase [Pyrobaculum neutrophilum]ACB39868.1 phosphotransferase KptA/Tpt1 [Pyrobaculum neutrophilum V24Sta]
MRDIRRCPVCGAYVEVEVHCGAPTAAVLDGATRLKISKLLSLALRHSPRVLGIELDGEGWADLNALAEGMRRAGLPASPQVLKAVAQLDDKGRFEIRGGRVRARYGHTIKVHIRYEVDSDTPLLYHGTAIHVLPSILSQGILPMRRLYVHLAVDVETACLNARRRQNPAVVEVDADCVRKSGNPIYKAAEKIRLTPHVPPTCVRRWTTC